MLDNITRKERANDIIHGAAVASATAAGTLAQVAWFGADTPILTAITLGMIHDLGELFDRDVSEAVAMDILAVVGGSIAGVTIAKGLVGWIPGIGNLANAAATATTTEAIGWSVYNYFKNN